MNETKEVNKLEIENFEKYKNKDYGQEVVKIVNIRQAKAYMLYGLKPLDVYATNSIVFVFSKVETLEVYHKWCNHSL